MEKISITELFGESLSSSSSSVHPLSKRGVQLRRGNLGKRYSRQISRKLLNLKEVPKDINGFIEELYPNMLEMCNRRFYSSDEDSGNIIINDFVCYMLSPVKDSNKLHYELYDPVLYPGMSFVMYFLRQLQFYILKAITKSYEDVGRVSIMDEGEEEETSGVIYGMPELQSVSVWEARTDFIMAVKRMNDFLEKRIQDRPKSDSYRVAGRVISLRVQGYKNNEIAEKLGISLPGVCLHIRRIRGWMRELFPDVDCEVFLPS